MMKDKRKHLYINQYQISKSRTIIKQYLWK